MQTRLQRVIKNLRLGLNLAWSTSPRAFVQYSLLGTVSAAMPPIAVLLGAHLVNYIAESRMRSLEPKHLIWLVIGLWAAATVQRTISGYMTYNRGLFIRRVELEAERRLIGKASKADVAYFANSDWHDRLARAKRDVNWRPGDLTWSLLGLSGNLISIVLLATLLATLHYGLVVLAIASALVSLTLEGGVTSRVYDFLYKEAPQEREREYLGNLLVNWRFTNEVRAYVLAEYLLTRHSKMTQDLFDQRRTVYKTATRVAMLNGFLTGTTLALAYVFVALYGIAGKIEPGGVVLVIGAFTSLTGILGQIAATCVAVDQHTTFLEDYFSFLASEPLLKTPFALPSVSHWRVNEIVFENVIYSYPGMRIPAIHSFDLRIGCGELIALVGENGAGKSTLIKLLLRFYDVDQGAIRVGGIDVKHLAPDILRSRIGVLFQDYVNYELSVRDNVILGRPDCEIDDARLMHALHNSGADALLRKLPKGIDSRLGRLFEGGHELSGGEWQRIALARLLYRNADVWILDEPTAALDPASEAAVFAELKANLKGRIGIVISHRFSTVRMADRIAVIANGRVTELGTHDELVEARGRYAELFELQAAGYR